MSDADDEIGFNHPYVVGAELDYIREALANRHLSGNGPFTRLCNDWLERETGARRSLLTHSCTGALEMSAILVNVGPGDEVVMPSFTFVSTANAFVLRGAVPVFVDVRPDTLNIDEALIEAAITERTKAIVVVHYAGVGCEMTAITQIAVRHGLYVIEDAAQGILATYRGLPLGSFGALAALSFHETKNVHCGEGGALLVNDPGLVERAEIAQEKGTNRRMFFRGQVDKYTWVDIGSSFLPSELGAAFLWAQLEHARRITDLRLEIWERYHAAFAELEANGRARRPIVPEHCRHNAHMYYLLLPTLEERTEFIRRLNAAGIHAVFHYVPLHESPAGLAHGRAAGDLAVTDDVSSRLVRLPLWAGMAPEQVERIVARVHQAFDESAQRTHL